MSMQVMDHARGYGVVSRFFHWSMAALILWQAISAALHFLVDDTPLADFFFAWHQPFGLLLLVLVALRAVWGLINIPRRPQHVGGLDKAAALGHVAMYGLLFAVPVIALIRSYGSGRGFSAFGIQNLRQVRAQDRMDDQPRQRLAWRTGLGSAGADRRAYRNGRGA
ncbi:cytochrome b/b6 domain-containing protein [uncultured Roseovarius sp.]|uniref:cytochrome b n=1 Tax=uncultured Roseovarius sp. TaxID=293344 RepID=UPI0025950430|nr:cytochrome b/b6 domain-containing protein [uncultured Roseovarius sp.]